MMGDLRRYAAANARVRVLLAALLGRSGLEALYNHPSADAVCDALTRTPYGPVSAATIERDLLNRLMEVGRTLLALMADPERAFLHLFLLRHEVENLKTIIRALHVRMAQQGYAVLLTPLPGIGTLDAGLWADLHDIRELVDRLGRTVYGPPLHAALHRLERSGPFALEVALDLDYYDRLWCAAAALHAADAERARRLLGVLFDILNLGWIARYRDALGLAPEEILNYTLREGHWISLDLRRRLAEDHTLEWAAALVRTPYGALLAEVPPRSFDAVSVALWRFLAGEIQRALTGYPFHIAVPLGFLLAQEIEIRDLRVLLAAKEIGVSSNEVLDHVASVRH